MRTCKKAISVLLVTLLLLCMSVTAFAADGTTNITANVPCTVSMQIGDHGKVTVDSTDYTGSSSFQKDVGAVVDYTFKPSALYAIDKVIYDGTDVTAQLSGNTYTAPALDENKALQVSFRLLGIGEDTTYTVTFHTNGHGTAPAAQTIIEGNTATEPPAPTESGWTFGGWYKDASCTESQKYLFSAAVNSNLDLYAKWTKNSGGGDPIQPGDEPTNPGDDTPTQPGEQNPETGAPVDPNAPQTGNNSNISLWVALMFVAGIGVVATAVYGRKKKVR